MGGAVFSAGFDSVNVSEDFGDGFVELGLDFITDLNVAVEGAG